MSELLFFIIETMFGGCIGVMTLCLIQIKPPERRRLDYIFIKQAI